jgi:cell division septation protein DedD
MMTKNTRRFEFKLGRIGLIFFLLGISGLLFGVFLLGVTVGKNIDTYPEKIARFLPDKMKTLISLPPDTAAPVLATQDEVKQETPEPDLNMTFHDLGKRKADTKGMAPDGMFPTKAPAGGGKERSPLPPPEPVTPAVQPKPAPPVKEKQAVREQFLVQVVSYQDNSKADTLVKQISAMGYPARMEMIELPDKGKWFRVVMGAFYSRPEAQTAVDVVSRKNKGLNCVIRSVQGTGN